MLQDKLPELINRTTNFKILVAASYKAKQSLAAKGLTPAIFLDAFYRDRTQGVQQLSYIFKERQIKPLPQFTTIDMDDYNLLRKEEKNAMDDIDLQVLSKKMFETLSDQKIKYMREIDKSVFADKSTIQNFINNQSYHWFEKANKMYYHALTLGQDNYRVNTGDQPVGVCYVVEVQKDKSAKQIFEKIRNEVEFLVRKLFELNTDQISQIKGMLIILFDVSQGSTIQQALDYTQYFKNSTNIHSSLIYRLAINGQDASDTTLWSRFDRPVFHFGYTLKSGDPVRLVADEEIKKVGEVVAHHKQTIRRIIQARLDDLARKHQQINKPTKLFVNFFKGSTPNDKTYTKQEAELRQLADKLFILEDYKRAYEIYKSLVSKLEKRNPLIENNLSEMIQLCLAMSKFHNLRLKSDPYFQIQKYAERVLKFYQSKSKLRLKKYLIFLVYTFHTFRTFNRQFIRSLFYSNLKSTFSSSNPVLNIVPVLIYEQFANMNLLYKNIDYRRYCYDMTRVATRFSEVRLYGYALRCFLVVEAMYRNTFANIEKYQAIQLSHLFIEAKNVRESLKNLKSAWQVYINRMQSDDPLKNEQELTKIIENYSKMIKQIQRISPHTLQQMIGPNLNIPIVYSLNLQTKDEMLEFDQKSGTKWQEIGESILQNKELMGAGLNQRQFRNLFKSFDHGVPQQKYLIHKFNSSSLTQAILKKNSRNAYIGQPLKLSFYMRNPVRGDIDIDQITIKIKQKLQQYKITSENTNITIKSFKSEPVVFTIIPCQSGFLQIQRIQWIFMKLITEHRIKEPGEILSQERNCYFKINVLPAVGCLQCKANFEDNYYEGQKTQMKVVFKNSGVEPITKIYMATGQPQTFGFKITELNLNLAPNSEADQTFQISIPLVHDSIQSGQQKRICKLLFLYKTGEKFRVTRTINKFHVLRIAKIENVSCERLSTHLHLLSFSKKKKNSSSSAIKEGEESGLEWMIIPGGFEIVKTEAADLASQTNYFFFIRRGDFSLAKYQFDNWSKDLSTYPEQFLKLQPEQSSLCIRFLWRKQHQMGYIQKSHIPITINEHAYLSTAFPISFKINYQKQITHNFKAKPYLEVPIAIKLKNIIYDDELKITVNFIDGVQSDATWEGSTEKRFSLKLGAHAWLNIKYIVVRPGIYILSNQIKYSIVNSKAQFANIIHSDYQKIYLTVSGQGNENATNVGKSMMSKTDKKKEEFDPFKQFTNFGISSPRTTEIKIDDNSLI